LDPWLDQNRDLREITMNSKPVNIFDAYLSPGRKSLSAEQFIELARKDRDDIKSVKFVPPRIGSDGFGRFDVDISSSSYEVAFE